MEAEDPGAGQVVEEGEGQVSAGGPGSQDHPGDQEDPGRDGSGEAGAEGGGPAQGALALNAPSNALVGPVARIPRPEPIRFSFVVPFRSTMEAEMAWEYFAQRPHPHPENVEQEITVSEYLLTIQLAAEDPAQLLTAFVSFLHELTLLIRTMQRLLPAAIFLNPRPEKGG
uniref:Uncharacterized protein n=1 Tax=Pipistrellus kuhlii TaxID=59472 RepID=A0A7J7S4S5_PIPKU|nr:hypothetical protein mPipKuh1_010176 [Pipistrellus kuhlii]